MAAVSPEYLATLKALAHPDYDRAASEATMLAKLQAGLPNWTAAPADNIRRSLPLMAELLFLHGEQENNNFNMGQMINAKNLYLDVFGIERGIIRRTGESDEDYLVRVANGGRTKSIGALASIEQSVTDFNTEVVDVQAVERINRQDVDVYSLKAGHVLLDTAENTALNTHLNDRAHKIAGVDIYLRDSTKTAFQIDVTIRHGAAVSAETLIDDARAALYKWLTLNQRLGEPVYRSAITSAAFVSGASDVTAAKPPSDLAAVAGTAYTCASDMTDVVVRTVAI